MHPPSRLATCLTIPPVLQFSCSESHLSCISAVLNPSLYCISPVWNPSRPCIPPVLYLNQYVTLPNCSSTAFFQYMKKHLFNKRFLNKNMACTQPHIYLAPPNQRVTLCVIIILHALLRKLRNDTERMRKGKDFTSI